MKNKKSQLTKGILFGAALSLLALIIFTGCPSQQSMLDNRDAASKVYVAPGEYDDYYAFLSGGFSGQMSVWGLPSAKIGRASCREREEIAVEDSMRISEV